MPSYSFLARWYLWLVSPRRVDTRGQCSSRKGSSTNDISLANTPAYILYHGKGTGKDQAGKKIWTRIGAVWSSKSGKGFSITWDYLPLEDGVTVMLPYDKQEQDVHFVPDECPA
jgi:hypothetical protein